MSFAYKDDTGKAMYAIETEREAAWANQHFAGRYQWKIGDVVPHHIDPAKASQLLPNQ